MEAMATLGAGCFWCVEACFLELKGVVHVEPGYSGGTIKNPGYKEVCTGRTGHAEVVRIHYNSDEISFEEILRVFFFIHNPTTLNRQGGDIGTQYRSVIFYHDEQQKEAADKTIAALREAKVWDDPIVTEVSPLINYYQAEDYHHNYLENNPENPYCQSVVRPKYEKFKQVFAENLK